MFTMSISMKLILQLSLIVILWNDAVTQELDSQEDPESFISRPRCVKLENIDLRIPENSTLIRGVKDNDSDSWYHYVEWLDTFAGDLTITIKRKILKNGHYRLAPNGRLEMSLLHSRNERIDNFLNFFRKALGLIPYTQLPGEVRVPSTLFSNGKCVDACVFGCGSTNMRFTVKVFDDDNTEVLIGHVSYSLL